MTASGVPRNWPYRELNSNRLRVRSADHQGRGPFNQNCLFPFIYAGETYEDCTEAELVYMSIIPWNKFLIVCPKID